MVKCDNCNSNIAKSSYRIGCSGGCKTWYHARCAQLTNDECKDYSKEKRPWFCVSCKNESNLENSRIKLRKGLNPHTMVDQALRYGSGSVDLVASGSSIFDRGSSISDRRLSNIGVYPAVPSASVPELPILLDKADFDLKDCVALTQLHRIIMEQNSTMQSLLKEVLNIGVQREKISNLEAELIALKSEIQDLKVNTGTETRNSNCNEARDASESMYNEIQERSFKSKNVIVYNVPESFAVDIAVRVSHDKTMVTDILKSMDIDEHFFKASRIGRKNGDNPRPLRVMFNSTDIAKKCLKNRKRLNEAGSPLKISADMTLSQRNFVKRLHQELDQRKSDGEANLVIRYFQGIPKIVKQNIPSKNAK